MTLFKFEMFKNNENFIKDNVGKKRWCTIYIFRVVTLFIFENYKNFRQKLLGILQIKLSKVTQFYLINLNAKLTIIYNNLHCNLKIENVEFCHFSAV